MISKIGWVVSFFWISILICMESNEIISDYPMFSALLTFAVIIFIVNKTYGWYSKAQKWDSLQEARKMQEWEKKAGWNDRSNQR
ncbi:hypothetical protein NEJ09_004242 [Salmonella enterica]|nr:hypothetical protein [Salmonella enterica]HCM1854068.1 hypothetical protein [Salmonella enterica subsp. arizonae serovar 56:z4,z23:-]EDI9916625.1 hypothetical protein [Salmonella enterica]EGA9875482.1 hypothetical protein [Salmonella enterica]EGL5540529.1 hypothetical protein [Salmonella enterica]